MPNKVLIRYTLVLCLTVLLAWPQASAQFGNTYYHMFGVPQSNQLNPAFQPICDGYLGLPFVGPVKFEVESNSLKYGDVFEYNSTLKKNISFMHPEGNKQAFMNALEPVNTIRAEIASNIISVGWRKEQLYFTVDLTERLIESTSFPKDFAEFLVYGNLNKSNFSFSDLAQNLMYFHEFAVGASYNFDDEMQFGVRAKLLLGGANFTTRSSDINLKTSIDEWKIRSDIKVDATLPYLEDLPVDQDGYLDMDSLANTDSDLLFRPPTSIADLLSPSSLSTIGGINNPGFAIDFGFNYLPVEKLNISASVIDLGFIRWKQYVYNFEQSLDYTFDGIEFKLEDDWSPGDELLDSLRNDLKVKVTEEKFTTALSGKVYLGVAYDLTEKVRFGGVFRTRIYNYQFYNQITVSANVMPISIFSASLSYSIYGNNYMNLGLGLSLRLGPINVYFISDQAPSAYFWPAEFSSLNFRVGLNIVWGCRPMAKAMKDRPLID
jgi:hypothetical protein